MAMDFALICSSVIILFIIAVGVIIFFKLAKVAFKWLITIILNSVVGIVLFLLLHFIGIVIPIWPQIIPVAIFGLPALATMLILKFFGVSFPDLTFPNLS
jgi:hypothetical protein